MKNRTIQLLHQGKRRKIEKQQYSKLRSYNKIKSSRLKQSQVSEGDLQSFSQQVNQEEILAIIQQLSLANQKILKQNKNIMRDLNKEDKINRLITKKIPLPAGQLIHPDEEDFYIKYQENIGRVLQLKRSKQYLMNLQRLLQLKLSFDLIKFQQKLQERREQHRKLSKNGKNKNYLQHKNQLNQEKLTFIRYIYQPSRVKYHSYSNSDNVFQKVQQMKMTRNKLQEVHRDLYRKIKQGRKNRGDLIKNLEQVQFQLQNLERLSQRYKKASGQNSCEYIEVQNGQMRSQQDINKQLKQIAENIAKQQSQLHQFVEGKMLQKIFLIQEIQKYELQCKRLGKKKLSSTSPQQIKII